MTGWKRLAALLPVLVAAVFVWPLSWGGQLAYVTTHGISMEPGFHTGDLAVVEARRTYAVGDVAAYRSDVLKSVVLHRIVAVDNGRYTFQGDNNSWLDEERPTRSQLIGALVLRVPQGGVWLRRLTGPPALGTLAFAVLAVPGERRRRRRKARMSRHAAPRRTRPVRARSAARQVGVCAAAVGITGALAGLSFLTPAQRVEAKTVQQPQTMTLSYRADVTPSAAYDSTVVTSPQPVFRKVAEALTLELTYQGSAGQLRVDALLSTPGGWTSTVELTKSRTVQGGAHRVRIPLQLSDIDRRAQAAARTTGLAATPVTVVVVATATRPDGQEFAPTFPLTLTPLALSAPDGADRLTARDSEAVTTMNTVPAEVSLRGHAVTVSRARQLALGALALAVLSAGAALGAARAGRTRSEEEDIHRRWRELLLEVQPFPVAAGRQVVDVPAFDALVRVAQRYELLVLHWARSGVHTYVVQDDATAFRYRVGGTASGTAPAELAPVLSTPPAD